MKITKKRWNFIYSVGMIILSLSVYAYSKATEAGAPMEREPASAVAKATTPDPSKPDISPRETEGLLRNDFAVLVDVREKDELKEGMADRAEWFPLSKAESKDPADQAEFKKFMAGLPKDKKIILYCRSGKRAGKFAGILQGQGFKTANMGGFKDWKDAGLPVKKPGK